jgi:hypothetical protein
LAARASRAAGGGLLDQALGTLLFKAVVIARIERQLAALKMQDVVDDVVQQIPLMADDDQRAGIGFQEVFQPRVASRSRWFDGSSSSITSGAENSSEASATHLPPTRCCPGDGPASLHQSQGRSGCAPHAPVAL